MQCCEFGFCMVSITLWGDFNLGKAALLTVAIFYLWTTGAIASNAEKVVVFPLDADHGIETLDWLSEGIALSLAGQLKAGKVKIVSRKELIQTIENADLPPGARLSRASMIRVAQKAGADLLVMGKVSGVERNLKIAIRVLDLKSMKLSGEIAANGPLSAMPQMENELAWLILSNLGLESSGGREIFQQRMRKIPNTAYAYFIGSLESANQKDQIQLLSKAVGAHRHFPEAQFRLAQLLFAQKDCISALPHLALAEDSIEKEFMKGTCLCLKDSPEQGIQSLSTVLSISRSLEVLNNTGLAYLRKGDTQSAFGLLSEARIMARTDSTVSMNLAIAHLIQGSYSEAQNLLAEGIRSHPRNGMMHFLSGILMKKQGENDRAEEAMGKAKSMGINIGRLMALAPAEWTLMIFSWKD